MFAAHACDHPGDPTRCGAQVRRFAKAAIRQTLLLQSQEEKAPTGGDAASRRKAIVDIAVRPLLQLFRFLCRWSRGSNVSAAVWTSACE